MGFVLKFLIFFLIFTVLCSLLWEQLLAGKVYDCVWRIAYLGYFTPGDWFHGVEGGDKLQPGWSQQRLDLLGNSD